MWVGVELSAPAGRNDGSVPTPANMLCLSGSLWLSLALWLSGSLALSLSVCARASYRLPDAQVRGVRYFDCAPQHGVMVRPDRLLLPTTQATSASTSVAAGDSETGAATLREQVASMGADLKRATQSRRQADATRKQLEASLSDAEGKITAGNALIAEERAARTKAEERAVTLSQELARASEEAKRLQGYLGKSSGAADKRAAGMSLEEREAAVLGRERLLDERQAAIDASRIAKAALDEQARELAAREEALTAQAARIAEEQAELDNAKAFLEDFPAGAQCGAAESNASDEQSRRTAGAFPQTYGAFSQSSYIALMAYRVVQPGSRSAHKR